MKRWVICAACTPLLACSYAVVESGHGAVVMTTDGELSVVGEGATPISPLSEVDDFSLRQQEASAVFKAITADGVPLVASESLVTYHIVGSDLIAIDREIGPDFVKTLIEPVVQSAVRRVLASYQFFQLDTPHLREAEDRITQVAAERLRPYHIVLEGVTLKAVYHTLPGFGEVVSDTGVWEQRALEARTRIEIARKKAEQRVHEANGIAASNKAVAPTLTPYVLQHSETRAWEQLLKSPNVSVQVIDNNSRNQVEIVP